MFDIHPLILGIFALIFLGTIFRRRLSSLFSTAPSKSLTIPTCDPSEDHRREEEIGERLGLIINELLESQPFRLRKYRGEGRYGPLSLAIVHSDTDVIRRQTVARVRIKVGVGIDMPIQIKLGEAGIYCFIDQDVGIEAAGDLIRERLLAVLVSSLND